MFYLTIDGKEQTINYQDSSLNMEVELENEQEIKVHMKYKRMRKNEGQKCLIKEYYGIFPSLANQEAKFELRIKNDFVVIDIEDYGFERLNNKEYIWKGIVPTEGYMRLVRFSYPNGEWEIESVYGIKCNEGTINNTTLFLPIEFTGGNLIITELHNECPQTSNVEIQNNNYVIKIINANSDQVEFRTTGKIRNRSKGEWKVDITDEEVRNITESEIKQDLGKLKDIAEQIISLDSSKYPPYIKIASWIHENIKYDLNYSGRNDISPLEIYNLRKGVCHHFTVLFNSLMYSIGYLTLYASGYSAENGEIDNEVGHSWSMIKIKEQWVPFDVTWGIYSGKFPVCHIFTNYNLRGYKFSTTDSHISFLPHFFKAKSIG